MENAKLHRVLKEGHLIFEANTIVPCVIHKVSKTEACLEVHRLVPLTFDLIFDTAHARRSCRVVWRKGDRIGVVFEKKADKAVGEPLRPESLL